MLIVLDDGMMGNALDVDMWFKTGQRGCRVLMVDNFSYNRNRQTDDKTYWICSRKVSNYRHLVAAFDAFDAFSTFSLIKH